jgi:hypothetical protein
MKCDVISCGKLCDMSEMTKSHQYDFGLLPKNWAYVGWNIGLTSMDERRFHLCPTCVETIFSVDPITETTDK